MVDGGLLIVDRIVFSFQLGKGLGMSYEEGGLIIL
jgi:hypothetical protein